jgi:hypothetical protein
LGKEGQPFFKQDKILHKISCCAGIHHENPSRKNLINCKKPFFNQALLSQQRQSQLSIFSLHPRLSPVVGPGIGDVTLLIKKVAQLIEI